MPGLGTLINSAAIVAGGIVGLTIGKHMKERFQVILMMALGISVIFMALSGWIKEMLIVSDGELEVHGTYMMIISLVLGSLIGEAINLDRHLKTFGGWLKIKTGSSKDQGFIDGFVSASLAVCVGAMAVIGAFQDAIEHDITILVTKALLDGAIILVMSAKKGRGCVFSFIPVLIWQGLLTLCAAAIAPVLTDAAMGNLALVGNILIVLIGINLSFGTKIKVANMLPAIVIAPLCAYIPFL